MMSAIVHSEVDGIATTLDEAVAMVLMVIHGGVDTVTGTRTSGQAKPSSSPGRWR